MTISVTLILRDGSHREVYAKPGETLLKVAHAHGVNDIEGACGGAMACSTCHVIIHPTWYNKIPGASDDEKDMLDLAVGLTHTSRLACQITLTETMNGLVIKLPQSTNSAI